MREDLLKLFDSEDAVAAFTKTYNSIKTFSSMSLKDRHALINDIAFYKSEFAYLARRTEARLKEIEATQFLTASAQAEKDGIKRSNDYLYHQVNSQESLYNKRDFLAICQKWSEMMNSVYYTMSDNNKILGMENA